MNQIKLSGLYLQHCCREVPFNVQHALTALLFASILYITSAGITQLISQIGAADNISLALLHASGVLALALFWKMGRWGRARYDSFGASLLLLGAAYKLHAFIDALIYGTRFDALHQFANLPIPPNEFNLLLKGEFISVLALLLIACSWRLKIGRYIEAHSFVRNNNIVPTKISTFTYFCALLVDIFRRVFDISFGSLQQFTSLLFITGIAAIYFLSVRKKTPTSRIIYAFMLGTPLSLISLDSGMKEQIFFPYLPAAILFWTNFRLIWIRVAIIITATILLAISQLYIHHVRELTWNDAGDLDIPTITLVSSFIDAYKESQIIDALDRVSARVNMTTSHAATVLLADYSGHEPIEVFGLIPASMVPRILWPDKPVIQPGVMHTARILGYSGPLFGIRSSTAAGFATELYLGGWWIGVIFGAVTFGWLMAASQNWTLRFGTGFAHQSLCFVALYWAIRFDEKHVVYAYTSVIFLMIFIWMLAKVAGLLLAQGVSSSILLKKA